MVAAELRNGDQFRTADSEVLTMEIIEPDFIMATDESGGMVFVNLDERVWTEASYPYTEAAKCEN